MKLRTAMFCAAAVTAQFVSGKATRDALFLTSMDVTALPVMLIATSICSLGFVALNAKAARRIAPRTLVPALFVASGLLFLVESLLRAHAPSLAASALYLHISGAGPLLLSGFWLIASEQFDPRSAKKHFGKIAGAGTLGGLISALVTERIAATIGVPAMLPALAGLQFACALLVRYLAAGTPRADAAAIAEAAADDDVPQSAIRVVAETPYLRNLALLVLFGTASAALIDYLFKVQAVETFGRGDNLLRFFAAYYAFTSLVTFVIQASSTRVVLERFGLGLTTSTPSWALLLGSAVSFFAPGLGSIAAARGGESVLRSSLFRAGYEQFYTPIPTAEKRAAKSFIDVAFERLGDAAGGGLVRLCVLLAPVAQSSAILALAMVCSLAAVAAASRLNRGYVGSLEKSLMRHGAAVDAASADEDSNRTRTILRTIQEAGASWAEQAVERPKPVLKLDEDIEDMVALRSRDKHRVTAVLARAESLSTVLVPHVVPLLAWDAVANQAMFALRKVAEEHVGAFSDVLVDPGQDFAVRRRLARVFSICVSQRAADAVVEALDDPRFDVRCQAARSLTAIIDKNPRVHLNREHIFDAVLREATVGRPVWESRRLLDESVSDSPLDQFVRDRAGESLTHVFTLLALVLPREPLQIAFRGLHTDDTHLQGTALEYLESVLPPAIKNHLWRYLERKPITRRSRPRQEVIADLLRSNHSVLLNLEELRRRDAGDAADGAA